MKILFISRAFPPVVGGIENQNYELSKWLPKVDGQGKEIPPFFRALCAGQDPFPSTQI
ncbi:MAG: Glycosyl transferase, group 1 family [Candidatus Moranbacteria bacterium GW2011_GWE1_49_15]|nr:MAG: Glycosyl transferase, group 1 family [Candidatus Moranbacteria bacterium GW2011_GWE1_49_15]